MLSIMLRGKEAPIVTNQNFYKVNRSIAFSLVGLIIYWVVFPLLAFDTTAGFPSPKLKDILID